MPTTTILVLAAITVAFMLLAGTLGWAERQTSRLRVDQAVDQPRRRPF